MMLARMGIRFMMLTGGWMVPFLSERIAVEGFHKVGEKFEPAHLADRLK
jgi:hypothetical protein